MNRNVTIKKLFTFIINVNFENVKKKNNSSKMLKYLK